MQWDEMVQPVARQEDRVNAHPPPAGWQRFLAELRRRQVYRLVAVYGAAAFLSMQAADLILPRLGLPDWSITLVVVIALLGLPVAFALAWVFESSAHGIRRTAPAGQDELIALVAQPAVRGWPAVLAGAAGVALVAVGAWVVLGRLERQSYDSIAVLPFTNLSGQPENEYFGDGLAEELINALAGMEGLRVAARTSAFAFKGTNTDIRQIGDTLNVSTVLDGSVRRSAGRIRITTQLNDTRSGSIIWNQTYDRPLAELFSVQDAIASEIVAALAPRLRRRPTKELYRGGTKDVEAYDLYL
ncbi:MAG TPA: hypothetical protein VK864_05310, partial [Longimicrobiales bacterium]|nr:hypothetical protein [Longimicrobiales bacterium]